VIDAPKLTPRLRIEVVRHLFKLLIAETKAAYQIAPLDRGDVGPILGLTNAQV
jgi:hypothetical protein